MKHKIILFIKSYRPDFKSVLKLLKSIEKYNKNYIPVYLSVNDFDFPFFKSQNILNITLLKDSDIVNCTIEDPWRYQQVIKSSVHKLNICDNYLCLDSDSVFIRDFHESDFIYNGITPYTVMHESKAFLETMERIGQDTDAIFFKEATKATRKVMNINDTDKIWDYGPSPYLWSTKVWQEIEDMFRLKNKTFEDILMEVSVISSPSENVIYGEFLRVNKTIEIIPVGSFFKVYHYKKQYKIERKFHKIEKLKKIYLGIIFQSNWKKSFLMRLFSK